MLWMLDTTPFLFKFCLCLGKPPHLKRVAVFHFPINSRYRLYALIIASLGGGGFSIALSSVFMSRSLRTMVSTGSFICGYPQTKWTFHHDNADLGNSSCPRSYVVTNRASGKTRMNGSKPCARWCSACGGVSGQGCSYGRSFG